MSSSQILAPREAAQLAAHAYFALRNWIDARPSLGAAESRSRLGGRVPESATLQTVHTATSGFTRAPSGFGFSLTFERAGRRHLVLALRGSVPQLGLGHDLLTDLRGAFGRCGDFAPVHKGFARTAQSALESLARDARLVREADVVHCVGHSLGGAVATLIAGHYAAAGKRVKLYTFGSPRVGAYGAQHVLERRIGAENVYRVAHDLDPVTLVGPYPYGHLNAAPACPNFMTIGSPCARLGFDNHAMAGYLESCGARETTWESLQRSSAHARHRDAALLRAFLGQDLGADWPTRACVGALSLLQRQLAASLRLPLGDALAAVSGVDLLAELLVRGLYRSARLAAPLGDLLRSAARWAHVRIDDGVDFTHRAIQAVLDAMLAVLGELVHAALVHGVDALRPLPLRAEAGDRFTSCAGF